MEKSIVELEAELLAKKKAAKNKRKRPLGKTIMIMAVYKEWFIILFTCIFCWIKSDSAPLLYLIPAVFIEIGIEKAFYFNSSKATALKSMELNYDPNYDTNNFREVQ